MVHERGQVEVDRRVIDAFVNMSHAALALPSDGRSSWVVARATPRDVRRVGG
jgi:hypothetical protein